MAITMSLPNQVGHDVHPFFKPKKGPPLSIHPKDDDNRLQCKRQRTISPMRQHSTYEGFSGNEWAEQLKVAAFGQTPASAPTSSSKDDIDESVSQSESIGYYDVSETQRPSRLCSDTSLLDRMDNIPPKELEQSTLLGNTATPENNTFTPSSRAPRARTDGKVVPSKTCHSGSHTTPPKKMLKVRPDGKLSSPRAKDISHDLKPKADRKINASDPALKTLMTTVKYGVVGTSRLVIGAKIDNILSGKSASASLAKSRTSEASRSPKTTHPFFLGGTARIAGRKPSISGDDLQGAKADVPLPTSDRKRINATRARVTSKPAHILGGAVEDISLKWKPFGTDYARVSRVPGAIEPMWPSQGMLHVGRGSIASGHDLESSQHLHSRIALRKLKGVEVNLPMEEQISKPFLDLVHTHKSDQMIPHKLVSRDWREFRRPLRRLLNGTKLQRAVHRELDSKIIDLSPDLVKDQFSDELSMAHAVPSPPHKALQHVYEAIATSSTAFDKFECESQEWVHKYAPKTTEDVLQQGREMDVLRDWLKNQAINSVGIPNGATKGLADLRRLGVKLSKRKRRRTEELDGFLISSDEEPARVNEISHLDNSSSANHSPTRSTLPGEHAAASEGHYDRSAVAVVISGPHGCGKTAAVYAVAQELGFEVFEINAGSRRSGRDILDKVGDMTRNHLVKNVANEGMAANHNTSEDSGHASDDMNNESQTRRQGTMNSFLKARGALNNRQSDGKVKISKASPKPKKALKVQQKQKQSLILLEEVDVLFEEDKMFWTTILDLILHSKRPVIMTCTDESLLPLEDMVLYANLRLASPPEQLAVDYLLLIACNEGHLLSRTAVSALYRAKGSDLRASISELNFFCQMAIGDNKGGLEWMLVKSATDDHNSQKRRSNRVVSENTYQPAMGWLGGELHQSISGPSLEQESELLSEVWSGWGIDMGAFDGYLGACSPISKLEEAESPNLEMLRNFDIATEALSAADTFPACVSREPDMTLLEAAGPNVTDRARSNYTEGLDVLFADPVQDHHGISVSLVITLRACARRVLWFTDDKSNTPSVTAQSIANMIPGIVQERHLTRCKTKTTRLSAFESIARSTKAVLGAPKGPQTSSFDMPISVIAVDLAPYVRSIVSYDLRLEDQRRQLSSLLSGPVRVGTKARTTRSSRAALEGGQKANTRRERWFPNNTNFDSILQSGGTSWQDALLQIMAGAVGEAAESNLAGSRRSSLGSAMESDV